MSTSKSDPPKPFLIDQPTESVTIQMRTRKKVRDSSGALRYKRSVTLQVYNCSFEDIEARIRRALE